MKTKAFLIATFVIAASLFSCSNENNEGMNPPGVDPGTPTNLGLSLSFAKGDKDTKAAKEDNNSTTLENALNIVDVYIFNSNSGIMVKFAELTSFDFNHKGGTDDNIDIWEAKTNILTTTGEKTVFVGINLPRNFAQGLRNKPLAVFNDNAQMLGIDQLVASTGLAMFSAKGITSNLKPKGHPDYDNSNILKIPVKRLVAKVTVEESVNMQIKAPGKIENLTFAINNMNRKFYMVPKPDGSDPNYEEGSWIPSDFINAVNTPGQAGDGYIAVNPVSDGKDGKELKLLLYTTENTSVNHWKKEITRVTVRATFIPNIITRAQGAGFIDETNLKTLPETFWSVILQNGYRYYFLTEDDATLFHKANPGSLKPIKYIDGYCYYDMYLNKKGIFNGHEVDSKKWDVFRNDYYRCRITSILAPGRPSEEPENPETPPDFETDIKYEINILFWNLVVDDYDLEP